VARAAGCWVLLHYSRGADCVGIAWAYVRFGSLPKVEGVLYAIKPAVVAIVIQALLKLGVRRAHGALAVIACWRSG